MKVVITGANSAVGQAILRCAAARSATRGDPKHVCRSGSLRPRRRRDPASLGNGNSVVRISYDDPGSLSTAFEGASAVIHLAGVLVERPGSTYEQANVAPAHSVVEAAKRSAVKKFVLVSATGADETSANRYYRTQGAGRSSGARVRSMLYGAARSAFARSRNRRRGGAGA